MAQLENARNELRRFEQEDRPAFGRWMAAVFGSLLTEIREIARLVHEQEALIAAVEAEMLWSDLRDPRKAYALVMKRRENPELEDLVAPGPAGEADPEMSKEERLELFDDFARSVLGLEPSRMSAAAYTQMFADFEAEMFGESAPEGIRPAPAAKKPAASRQEVRLKELYRTLVRRLHPDLRADGEAAVSALWHEVQEAYEARDCNRLETLLALTEVRSDAGGGSSSLAQMRATLAELKQAWQAIQRSMANAQRDPAWNFSRARNTAQREARVRRELERDLADQRWLLADLKRIVAAWSRPPQSQPKKRAHARGNHAGPA